MSKYPSVTDESQVGEYTAKAMAGGGYVWDEVLEYRVWCNPRLGAPDLCDGDDYYYAYATYEEAYDFSKNAKGAEKPLALILQCEYIEEPETGEYIHVKEQRIAEWPVEFLSRPKRSSETIPNFIAPDAPENKLEIIRGLA